MDGRTTRRGGDSALIDIRTFVRHLSAYFRSERWVSSNPYFEGEKRGSGLMEDVFDVGAARLSLPRVSPVCLRRNSQTNTLSSINPSREPSGLYDDKGKQIGTCKTLD